MRNEVFLEFKICDFEEITPDEISNKLGVKPTKVYVKGQKRNPTNPDGKAVFKNNVWVVDSGLDKYASFEQHMNAMLDIIEPRTNLFKPFCSKYYCEFACAIFIRYDNNESTPWIHLNERYNKLVKKLDIEFDIDLYCLPNKE